MWPLNSAHTTHSHHEKLSIILLHLRSKMFQVRQSRPYVFTPSLPWVGSNMKLNLYSEVDSKCNKMLWNSIVNTWCLPSLSGVLLRILTFTSTNTKQVYMWLHHIYRGDIKAKGEAELLLFIVDVDVLRCSISLDWCQWDPLTICILSLIQLLKVE